MAKLWFKQRRFGWGWTPASIEGWIVVAVAMLLIFCGTAVLLYEVRAGANPRLAGVLFILWTAIIAGITTAIAWAKGEKPGWRWG